MALNNLLINIEHNIPMEIYCNNEAAILIVGDNASKKKTKYLSRAFYFINDFIRQYKIKINWTNLRTFSPKDWDQTSLRRHWKNST
jgi:hypothetical protein